MSAPVSLRVSVLEGCPAHGLRRGETLSVELSAVPGVGVRASFPGRTLYLSGNRVRVPGFSAGDTFRVHGGDPTRSVKLKVEAEKFL